MAHRTDLLERWGPPDDWSQLHWHVDPRSLRYKSVRTATRACGWLNNHAGPHDCWEFRPGPFDGESGRYVLERRWIGEEGVIDFGRS